MPAPTTSNPIDEAPAERTQAPAPAGNYMLYDGECPFCSRFVRLTRLRAAIGKVELIDARSRPDLVQYWTERGFDIDEGMLVHINGRTHWGADAVNMLALMSTPVDAFNKLNAMLFQSKPVAAFMYPAMRFGRNLTLRLLGRKKLAP